MTGDKTSRTGGKRAGDDGSAGRWEIGTPVVADGPALHRITRESGVLDVNSVYAYLLWCRDFSRTSAVARLDGRVVGFVTGFVRPDAPDTVVVWQIAVESSQRGAGLAARLLHHLVDELVSQGVRYLETTITPDNTASIRLFSGLARDRGTEITRSALFTAELFPDAHQSEDLYRIGPFVSGTPRTAGTTAGQPQAADAAGVSDAAAGRSGTPGSV